VFCVCWLGALDWDVCECVLAVSGLQGAESCSHHHMERAWRQSKVELSRKASTTW